MAVNKPLAVGIQAAPPLHMAVNKPLAVGIQAAPTYGCQ